MAEKVYNIGHCTIKHYKFVVYKKWTDCVVSLCVLIYAITFISLYKRNSLLLNVYIIHPNVLESMGRIHTSQKL